jgi:hypothetical protein
LLGPDSGDYLGTMIDLQSYHIPGSTYFFSTGSRGGAIANLRGQLLIERSMIDHNPSTDQTVLGGGIYSLNGTSSIVQCRVASNNAFAGGGIYIDHGFDPLPLHLLLSTRSQTAALPSEYLARKCRRA